MGMSETLRTMFTPASVAVVGPLARPGDPGQAVIAHMLEAGYKGRIIPVDPASDVVLGLPVTRSIAGLPWGTDLAVVALPALEVLAAMTALAEAGTRAAVVLSSGFKETGREGYLLEQQLVDVARTHGMAVLGPNSLGMMHPAVGLNASLCPDPPASGGLGFFSQSQALCSAILDWAAETGVGFSRFASLGNKAVLDETDLLGCLGSDPETRVILGYVENIEHGRAFMDKAREVSRKKPVVMIKSGISPAGSRAASSHTGAMCGSDQACATAFKQSGIIRAKDVAGLFTLGQAFATQPLPRGPNLAIVTNAGGPGILATDACARSGLYMPRPGSASLERLRRVLPPYASLYNPIDMTSEADPEVYREALDCMIQDPLIHSLLVITAPTPAAAPEAVVRAVIEAAGRGDKPVFACFMGRERAATARQMLQEARIPCHAYPEQAIRAIEAMYAYFLWTAKPDQEAPDLPRNREAVSRALASARSRRCQELVEYQAQAVLTAYGVPTLPSVLARTSDEAEDAARDMGLPVALKLASPHLPHRHGNGAVRLGLDTPGAVREAFQEITSRAQRIFPDAYVAGCLVQEMAPRDAREVVLGFTRDAQFGPLVFFGLGGVFTDVLGDFSRRLAPVSGEDARTMTREIRAALLLKGSKGERRVNFEALEEIILRLSLLAVDFPEIHEAEFNPVLVNDRGALVADARLALSSGGSGEGPRPGV